MRMPTMNDVTATATSKGVYTDFRDLTRLQQKAAGDGTSAVKEASKQYEAVFIQMMLKSMRQALPGDPLFGSQQQDMYQDLFDKQVSMSMAAKGTIGLADIIARQLQRNMQMQNPAGANIEKPPAAAPASPMRQPAAAPVADLKMSEKTPLT
jgi:flagellar protein FlgJ